MNSLSEHDRLLNDVLGEEDYAGFREGLYRRGLGEVHRRRRKRIQARLLLVAAGGAALFATPFLFKGTAPKTTEQASAVTIIRSQPLAAEQIVRTGQAGQREPVERIKTDSRSGAVEVIPDETLLGMFAGRPVALVAAGSGSKELLFLNSEDEQAFRGPPD